MIFPDNYSFEIKRQEKGGDLLITVSSSSNFAFYMSDFGCATLYISDRGLSYYTKRADVLASGIVALMRERGCERAVFLGHSKGGFGSLLLAKLCARLSPNSKFGVLAFAPQVKLWPRKRPLSFPSYHRLLKAAKSDAGLMADLVEFGTLGRFNEQNLQVFVHCGSDNKEDTREVNRLFGKNVSVTLIQTSSHMAHLPYVVDTTDPGALKNILNKAYSQNSKIEGELPEKIIERTFREMSKIPKQKMITELVSDVFDAIKDA